MTILNRIISLIWAIFIVIIIQPTMDLGEFIAVMISILAIDFVELYIEDRDL